MRRRNFIKGIGGAAATWPLGIRAQQGAKMPVIGFLGPNTATTQSEWTAAFLQQLAQHGWVDGQTVKIEYRWGEGRAEPYAELVAEFVRIEVDVIATAGSAPALAAKKATADIPIVFASTSDPVEVGLVASLALPGGNVTGLSAQLADLAAKRLELFREVIPGLRRIAMLGNADAPGAVFEMRVATTVANKLNLQPTTNDIRSVGDIAPAIDRIKGQADALFVVSDPLVFVHRARINTLALGASLPTMHSFREHVHAGGLMA